MTTRSGRATGRTSRRGDRSKSERTRARILDATAAVLARNGYAGTRLSDIAEQAGVQAPAIYYYYPSRERLVEEVVITGLVRHLQHVRDALAALPEDTPALDRIGCAVEAHLQVILRVSDYATAAIRNTSQLPPDIRARQLDEQHRYGDIWRELLEAAQAAGDLHPDLDLSASRMLVLGALNWACEWWNPRQGSLASVVSTAQLLVRHGLAGPPARTPTRTSVTPAAAPPAPTA
ncbi:TetR/AcrR family transcriptional regulator [Pseudonocardia sp. RS010]|uniref:TetR/AcrR family transcriptional regulator n=1 Tax=Pseudonocardia sp. RS010 TaxID=3385979 RepID=UPI0039A39924